MIPLWLMIAQGVKTIADNQNNQIDAFNKNQQYNLNGTGNGISTGTGTVQSNGLGNVLSSIYTNYLDDDDKKKNKFQL